MDLAHLSHLFNRHFHSANLVQDGINRIYRVDGNGEPPYYLRLYRQSGRSREEIDFELCLLEALPDLNGVAVAKPIPNVDGSLLSELTDQNESRLACMFEAAEGRAPQSNGQDMKRLGHALATLHNATSLVRLHYSRPIDIPAIICDSVTSLRQVGSTCTAIAQQIEHECRDLPIALTRSGLPLGPCHGDVWPGNVRLLDEKVTFFDFDDCGLGPYVIDLATPAWHLAVQSGTDANMLWCAFLDGYESRRQLNETERDALPASIVLQHLRSLLSLARFCVLPEQLWIDAAERTTVIIEGFKGKTSKFAFLRKY